jgi:hypothetical protein
VGKERIMTKSERLKPLNECCEHLEKAMAALKPLAYMEDEAKLARKIGKLWEAVDDHCTYVDSM